MNNIKIIAALFCLMLISSLSIAQGNCIKVYKGASGCGCHCMRECVTAAELPTYLADGWNTSGCWNCCKLKNWVESDKAKTSLDAVHPNNQEGSLTVTFTLASKSDVKIEVADMTGRCVATVVDEYREDVDNELIWDKSELSPGTYFFTLEAGEHRETKMITIAE
jgi:hypothetical protein